MKQKDGSKELVTELNLAFVWQDEIWESPDTLVDQETCENDAESPSTAELIEIVLSCNNTDSATTRQTES